MKRIFILVSFVLCLVIVQPLVTRAQQLPEPSGEVSFKLKGVDGKAYDLASMRGQVLLVSFGASWCQPCWAELRALEELKQEFKGQPVKFLWVSIEREEEASDGKLRSFAKEKNLTLPVLRDPSGFIYAQFSLRRRIPLVIFINQEGKLVAPQHTGMGEPELYKRTMRERLNKLLRAQTTVTPTSTK
jgi:peroxiredoxin